MRFASLAAGAAFATLIYRGKPVRIVNPFAAGGNTDLVTRALTERAAPLMKQSFIIENRPGAMTKVWTQSAVPPNPSGRSCASHLRPFAPLHAVPP